MIPTRLNQTYYYGTVVGFNKHNGSIIVFSNTKTTTGIFCVTKIERVQEQTLAEYPPGYKWPTSQVFDQLVDCSTIGLHPATACFNSHLNKLFQNSCGIFLLSLNSSENIYSRPVNMLFVKDANQWCRKQHKLHTKSLHAGCLIPVVEFNCNSF